MPCPDMSGHKRLKAKYEDDLKATIQELSELNQETMHSFDMEKGDKEIICTNKINNLTAKIAQLDEQLASLDEQIQRWKEENKPRPQSELAECKARSEAHIRAKLARIQ
ncbi:uncharacterized protein J4E88_008584 [Alternaria novae-zelandiae]|uniref:uncharacterized protein n=1 Tax=Alternaria novae-zelandiae TaxID=430562 RepID=UPI0020C49C3F|nr:uncharacterized protein J4E88_008584 [Alternaria novae-zelandiae]KAI4673529.1 hypothetical protein J4E88_008584 [Alternaria novae-zelandiae]